MRKQRGDRYSTRPLRRDLLPGIVRTKVPEVPLEVGVTEPPPPVVFVLDLNDDLRPRRLRALVDGIDIRNDHVRRLRRRAAHFIGLLHEPAELAIRRGPRDDHAPRRTSVANGRFHCQDRNDELPLESKGLQEPVDGCRCIPVTQARHDGREESHAFSSKECPSIHVVEMDAPGELGPVLFQAQEPSVNCSTNHDCSIALGPGKQTESGRARRVRGFYHSAESLRAAP